MDREKLLAKASSVEEVDVIVIGGGATGLGVAWDAATRGLSVLLLEGADFGSGTSSRSTKLIHGGLRYLRQGHLGLVRESLREKGWLLENAPDLVFPLHFVIPCRTLTEQLYYRLGTILYDALGSGPRSRWLSSHQLQGILPGLCHRPFRGAIGYWDAQFDDCRMAIALASQIEAAGGTVLNYMLVESLCLEGDRVLGVRAYDRLLQRKHTFRSKVVVNATGVNSDLIRRMASPGIANRIRTSRGSHIVIRRNCLRSLSDALIIPKTPDGRVVFLIPWLGGTLIGTTDVEVDDLGAPPVASLEEIDYLLDLASRYLPRPLERSDVASVFSGYRPLLSDSGSRSTSELSRDFEVEETASGLYSVLGGKWTTFRAMAEVTVNKVVEELARGDRACRTRELSIGDPGELSGRSSKELRIPLEGFAYTWGQVRQAVKEEMAVHLEDVLSRRLRCLFLDVRATLRIAPEVARFMADELGRDQRWMRSELESFERVARQFQVPA